MKKQEDQATGPTKCGQCGVEARPFLHHVRHRGCFRRLCTTCVLRLHSQSFCPMCFLPPSSSSISCSKCYSSSHSSCLNNYHSSGPYICQLCVDNSKPLLIVRDNGVDKKGASVLLAAARIAADSMSKAAAGAKAEAEKRVKEAAVAKRRAKEAIEELLGKKEKVVVRRSGGDNNNNNGSGGRRIAVNVDGSVLATAFNGVELRESAKCMEVVPVLNVEPIAVERGNGGEQF